MGSLSLEAEAAVTVAALTAHGRFEALKEAAASLAGRGVHPADLREAAYLASLFCGFPRGVAALVALSEVVPNDRSDPPFHHDPRPRAPRHRGLELFKEIHKENAARQLEMLRRVHPDFADTVIREAYGRVMSRSFLPIQHRELIGVAALAVMGLMPQLRAHLLGARHVGASRKEVKDAAHLACRVAKVGARRTREALAEAERLTAGSRPARRAASARP